MFKRVLSASLWIVGLCLVVPATSARAESIPLEGSHCWGHCTTCTGQCEHVVVADRTECERRCFAGNDRCCSATGRHAAPHVCGCY